MTKGPSLNQLVKPTPGSVFPKDASALFARENMKIVPALTLDPSQEIVTIGSCFARNIEEALSSVGFDVPMIRFRVPRGEWSGARPNGILNKYTPFSISQVVDWAVTCMQGGDVFRERTAPFWIEVGDGRGVDLDLGGLVPVSEKRFWERRQELLEVFASLKTADVVVITLGQTESWLYRLREVHWSGAPAVPSLRHLWADTELVISGVNDAERELSRSVQQIRSINPKVQVLFTVSPVPATRYWSGEPALRAYWQGKITLWSAAQSLVRSIEGSHYFPSFEAVHLHRDSWTHDGLHVTDNTVREIVQGLLRANSNLEMAVPLKGEEGYVSNVLDPPTSLAERVQARVRRLFH